MQNPILDSLNAFMKASYPGVGNAGNGQAVTNTLSGLPLGITETGEIGLKVIVIGNASANTATVPATKTAAN